MAGAGARGGEPGPGEGEGSVAGRPGRVRACAPSAWLAVAVACSLACALPAASGFVPVGAAAFACGGAARAGLCFRAAACAWAPLRPALGPALLAGGGTGGGRAGRARGLAVVCMSKKDQRYKLAKRGMNEDETVLAVAEQFRRREGQAQISWYPGHIAKAEKKLMEVLSAVDVVVEVRDARIPTSTTHPSVDDWLRNRNIQRVVCISKVDMAPRSAMSMWKAYLESLQVPVAFMNCKQGGRGLEDLKKIIKRASKRLNDRREARGMLPRNVRVAVMGYPNVGKSALLNRLAGVKKVKSENRAGVTKALQWVRVDGFDLLDSPGIIPAKLLTQEIAVHLAICDDIGQVAQNSQKLHSF